MWRLPARAAWQGRPEVSLRYQAHTDALIVALLPLPSEREVVVHGDLCLWFDSDTEDALPTACCLVGFAEAPDSPSTRAARAFLGEYLWGLANELWRSGDGTATVVLSDDERRERLRACDRRAVPRPR